MKNIIFFFVTFIISTTIYANNNLPKGITPEAIDQCRFISSNVDRLYCFDKIFASKIDTNIVVNAPQEGSVISSQKPEFVKLIQQLENSRTGDSKPFLAHIKHEQNIYSLNDETLPKEIIKNLGEVGYNVYLTKQPLDAISDYKPVLAISCIQDITNLQIVLPYPIEGIHSTTVKIRDDKDGEIVEKWRIIMDGYVISAPRGLQSIDYINTLYDNSLINFNIDTNKDDINVTFNIDDLSKNIKSIATACHWFN